MSKQCTLVRGTPRSAALLAVGVLLTVSCADDGGPVESAELADQPIVFTSDRDGTADLWVMDADGGRQAQLTKLAGDESSPQWSPDGTRVAFSASEGGGASDIYVTDADGENLRQITHTDSCEDIPTWSPDGTRLLVVSASDCEDEFTAALVVMSADGSNPKQLVAAPALWPDWSPDGRRIVYTGPNAAGDDTLIWISNADGTDATPLDLPGINSPSEPSWAPDGTRIAFVSPTDTYAHENPADWNEDVYVMNADGTNVERITTTAGNDHWPPAWSPDGRTIIYTSDGTEAEQGDLMAIDLDTRKVTRLTDTETNDAMPDWKRK